MATLRWMGVPEAELRMIEGTHEEIKRRVEYRRNSEWTGTGECARATVVIRSNGGYQQESNYERHSPQVDILEGRSSRTVGRVEGNLWHTWTESKSREDGGALGRAAENRSRYKTGR